jgi:polar amino acid transport system substrate-binding protein
MRTFLEQKKGAWRTGIVILCVALAGGLVSAQTMTSLRLVSTAWPPFTNESGQPRFALDLVEAAFARIGVSSKTAIVPAPAFTPSLLTGPFEGSAAAWKDPERERVLVFSQSYLENRLILIGRRGEDVSATTMAALKGKRIAIVEGYSYGDAIAVAGPAFVRTQREEESLSQLLGGAVDYTLMDDLVVRYITSNYPKESQARLQIGLIPLVTRPLHLAIRKALPDAEDIVKRFNAQILTMMGDRTYHRLLHLDWIRADVDGDGVAEYVPRSDRVGSAPPQKAYAISTVPETSNPNGGKPKFYVGGNMYSDWATIPRLYKVPEPNEPEPGRSTATLFTFRW